MQIAQNENHLEAATIHFNEQISIYGQQILINLVMKMVFIRFVYFNIFKLILIYNDENKRLIIEVQSKNWNAIIMILLICWTIIKLNMKHLIFIVSVKK